MPLSGCPPQRELQLPAIAANTIWFDSNQRSLARQRLIALQSLVVVRWLLRVAHLSQFPKYAKVFRQIREWPLAPGLNHVLERLLNICCKPILRSQKDRDGKFDQL